MTLANDSVLVTPGTGATVATHLVNSKEHQVVMIAGPSGHLKDTLDSYAYHFGANVGAQNKIHAEVFNATGSGKVVKLRKLFLFSNQAAITGVVHEFGFDITSAVGTGGTTITGRPHDSGNTALVAQITARHAPSGGATQNFRLYSIHINPEETISAHSIHPIINWLPEHDVMQDITLRENEGFRLIQITNNTAATWICTMHLTIE